MATRKTKGFKVLCPYCGDRDATINLDLNNLNVLTCSGCDTEFCVGAAVKKVERELARWKAVEAWIASAEAIVADPTFELDPGE